MSALEQFQMRQLWKIQQDRIEMSSVRSSLQMQIFMPRCEQMRRHGQAMVASWRQVPAQLVDVLEDELVNTTSWPSPSINRIHQWNSFITSAYS